MKDTNEVQVSIETHVKKGRTGNPNWKKGVSGNPAGRKKGARCRFGEEFVTEFAAHWAVNGKACLDELAVKHPDAYSRVAIAILPKVIEFGDETREAITEALTQRLPFDVIRAKIEKEDQVVH